MQHPMKLLMAPILVLASSLTWAGVIFVPVGSIQLDVTAAEVSLERQASSGAIHVQTTGLNGAFLDALGATGPEGAFIAFTQDQLLRIDRDSGDVVGRARARLRFSVDGTELTNQAEVTGMATCVHYDGRSCGQLIMDLELRGVLSDPLDVTQVGLLRMQLLGSLVADPGAPYWAALSASATFGGDEAFVARVLDALGDSEASDL